MPLINNTTAEEITPWKALEEETRENVVLKTYISYAPEDVPTFVKGLYEWLLLRYGQENVTIDSEIPPFAHDEGEYLRDYIGRMDVLFVVIGPAWMEILQSQHTEENPSRMFLEIKAALNEGVLVAPLCVRGAQPPSHENLPEELHPLLNCKFTVIESWLGFYDILAQQVEHIKRDLGYVSSAVAGWTSQLETQCAEFMDAYHAGDMISAYAKLNEIEIESVPLPYRTQLKQYARKVYKQVQVQKAKPYYQHILSMVDDDPTQSLRWLSHLLNVYPEHGDPKSLYYQMRGVSEEAALMVEGIYEPEVLANERREIGMWLAENDPRRGVGVRLDGVPDIAWVKVSEGEFIYYFDKQIYLPDFYISRYPITYQQFQAFIDDGGYENELWWEGLSWRELQPSEQQWPFNNHPRERVSWYDAVAFCRWLSTKEGYTIRLPKEEEWEKSARGRHGRIYPWGDLYITGYANINEVVSGLGPNNFHQTVAVGLYPLAASPFGVEDMIGNVWEWCLNAYDKPSYIEESGTFKRVMRGGCWDSDRLFAHTARRRGELAGARLNILGFRVVAETLPSMDNFMQR